MSDRVLRLLVGGLVVIAGCASPPREIFPAVNPPVRYPSPPDAARIQYVGALRGSVSLGVQPSGWEALAQAITGASREVPFVRPSAVAVGGMRVYVADTGLGVVHALDLEARTYEVLQQVGDEALVVPLDVVIAEDVLVVADRARAAVDLQSLDGSWRSTLRVDALQAPVALAWDAARELLWVADAEAHAVVAVRLSGEVVATLGRRGGEAGAFNFPAGVAIDARLGLIVADSMNFRVQIFPDPLAAAGAQARGAALVEPEQVVVFGRKGNAAGDFALPRDVAVDSAGHVYVLDNQFETVQIFDAAGRLLMAFGHQDGPGRLAIPAGITIDARDRIWIADSFNQRVAVFDYLTEVALCVPY